MFAVIGQGRMVTSPPAEGQHPESPARARAYGLFVAALVLGLAQPCAGQVLSLSGDGSAVTYDGPAVITDNAVTPIVGARQRVRGPTWVSPTNDAAFRNAARAVDLSPALLAAVAWRESNFRSDRVSRAGAQGEMQLMPATAQDVGVDPAKPDQNLRGGALYLRRLLDHYQGDLARSLAAYNAGPGAVDRNGGAPPCKETEAYVDAIMNRLSDMAAGATR